MLRTCDGREEDGEYAQEDVAAGTHICGCRMDVVGAQVGVAQAFRLVDGGR